MGKEAWPRITGEQVNTPGPGAYMLPSTFGNGPKYTIQRVYHKKAPTSTVGPELPPSSTNDSPRIHIGSIVPAKVESESPGPSYVPPPMGTPYCKINYPQRGEEISHSRKKEGEDTFKSGPGDYNIPHLPNEPSVPAFTIGARPKNNSWLTENENPGPLDYSPRIEHDGPKTSIRGVDVPNLTGITPGPADYAEKPKTTRYAYIHGTDYHPKEDETPGPGKYSIAETFAGSARHCSIRPNIEAKRDLNCAPYYDPKPTEFTKVKGVTIAKSPRPHPHRDISPGPAAYSPRLSMFTSGHTLPRKKTYAELEKEREKAENRKREEMPGPGAYNINYGAVEKNTPAFGFYGERASFSVSDTPGPSDYYPKLTGHSSPRYTIKHKDNRPEVKSFTQNAGYVVLKPLDRGPMYSIRPREKLNLIAE